VLSLVEPLDPRPIGLTRIVVGLAAVVRAFVALPVLLELTQPRFIKAPLLDWMPPVTVPLVWSIVLVWVLSAVLFALGWRVGLTGPVLLACLVVVLIIDLQTYSNHVYLMAWLVLLLVVADAGAGRSISAPTRQVARWTVLLVVLQISIVYLFSGFTKLNDDFLSGRVLAGVLRGGLVPFPDALRTPAVLIPVSVVTVLVEVFLAFGLWVPRFRRLAFVLGIGLHAGITLLISDTGELLVFSLLMVATYPLFAQVSPPANTSGGGQVTEATA
jgi:hypothetical protein